MVAWTVLGVTIAAVLVPLTALFLPLGAWLGPQRRGFRSWVPSSNMAVMPSFRRLMALLLEAEVPLPDALRLTLIALQGTALAGQCRAAAAAVEGGTPLDQALVAARFPDSLTALVGWGSRRPAWPSPSAPPPKRSIPASFACDLLNMLVLPIIYMLIVTFVGFRILALLMPVMSLIS